MTSKAGLDAETSNHSVSMNSLTYLVINGEAELKAHTKPHPTHHVQEESVGASLTNLSPHSLGDA